MTDDLASPIEPTEAIEPTQALPTDRPNRRRGRTVLIVGAVLIVVALIVSNVVLWMRYTDTRDKLDQTRQAVVSASTQVKDLSSRMDQASSSIGELPPGKDVARLHRRDQSRHFFPTGDHRQPQTMRRRTRSAELLMTATQRPALTLTECRRVQVL